MMKRLCWVLSAFACLLTACDITLVGQAGVVHFTPDNCGSYALGCDFDQSIVVGGSVVVRLESKETLNDKELVSSHPDVLMVEPWNSSSGTDWIVTALGEGSGTLSVVDSLGDRVDQINFDTAQADRLTMHPFLTAVPEPASVLEKVETWIITANTVHSYHIGPHLSTDERGMGEFNYVLRDATSPELDPTLLGREKCEISTGCLILDVPAGTYNLVVETEDGTLTLNAVIIAQDSEENR